MNSRAVRRKSWLSVSVTPSQFTLSMQFIILIYGPVASISDIALSALRNIKIDKK